MSIEQLLLLLLLVALPLIERLIRSMRAHAEGTPSVPAPAPVEPTVSRPGPQVSVPAAGAAPSERTPRMRRERTDRTTPRAVARHPGHPAVVPRSIPRGDLRRAMVLIAILGPCRALEPKDAAQPG